MLLATRPTRPPAPAAPAPHPLRAALVAALDDPATAGEKADAVVRLLAALLADEPAYFADARRYDDFERGYIRGHRQARRELLGALAG